MPIYQYRCDACGREFEKRQGFDAATTTECVCDRAATARRLISMPAIVFKGSGFYINDSRPGGAAGASDGSPSSEGAPAAKPAPAAGSDGGAPSPAAGAPASAPAASPAPAPVSSSSTGTSSTPG